MATFSGGTVGTGNISDGAVTTAKIANNAVTGNKIAMGSDTQGDILYYNGTDYTRLAPGTSGTFLKTQGASANPTWSNFNLDVIASGSFSTSAGAETEVDAVTVTDGANGEQYMVVFNTTMDGAGGTFKVRLSDGTNNADISNTQDSNNSGIVLIGRNPFNTTSAYLSMHYVINGGTDAVAYTVATMNSNWQTASHTISLRLNDSTGTAKHATWTVCRMKVVA